jgi:hypothetical protein
LPIAFSLRQPGLDRVRHGGVASGLDHRLHPVERGADLRVAGDPTDLAEEMTPT